MGSVVKAKVGAIEDDTREGRRIRMSKYVVLCVHAMVGKKIFLVQFGGGQKKYISSSLLVLLSSKGDFEMDEPLSNSPEK